MDGQKTPPKREPVYQVALRTRLHDVLLSAQFTSEAYYRDREGKAQWQTKTVHDAVVVAALRKTLPLPDSFFVISVL